MTNADIIENILRREGSTFTNRAGDRGGPTKFGITQSSWNDYIAHDPANAPTRDVESLTRDMAIKSYTDVFIEPLAFIQNVYMRELMVDSAVQHGPVRAIKWLQAAAGVTVDGVIGDETRDHVNPTSDSLADTEWQLHLYNAVLRSRIRFYGEIITRDPSQAQFAAGWLNRVVEFIR